uniref:SXP/RAL-2 family protein Ani s 5-like cation-binding domain-containing protein n=1 Tax=Acrobeloides nanus TaxID=290746 RepID=A0A914DQP4_9BILA
MPPKIAEPPTPPFLQNSPKSVIESFYDIIGNAHYLTDKEIDQEIERWVMKQSADVQSEWLKFQEAKLTYQEIAAKEHKAAYESLSSEAKIVDRIITSIATDEKLVALEKFNRIEQVLNSIPKLIRKEIESVMFQIIPSNIKS